MSDEHRPEFIVIENGDPESAFESKYEQQRQYYESIAQLPKQQFSFKVRIAALFGSVIMAFFALFTTLYTLFSLMIYLLSFGSETALGSLKTHWDWCRKAWVVTLGLLVAVVSPAFGFSLVLLYFLLIGANSKDDFIVRTFMRRM